MSAEHVQVRIPAMLYRALHAGAARRGMEVGELLAELAIAQLQRRAEQQVIVRQAKEQPKGSRVPMTTQRLEILRDMLAAGATQRQIAARIGVSKSCVNNHVRAIQAEQVSA